MEAKTTINLDKVRRVTLKDGIGNPHDLCLSPRQLLSLLSKSEIVEYLIQTGILNQITK